MSSATVRNISASSGNLPFMFATGLVAAAVQTLFLREYLSIFSGNELVIGVILALWLCATAIGSYAGSRVGSIHVAFDNTRLFSLLYILSIILGLLLLRASRLLFLPGAIIPVWCVPLIVLVTQSDAAFFCGFTYGRLARYAGGERLFLAENAGTAIGLFGISLCIIGHVTNGAMLAGVLVTFAGIVWYSEGRFRFQGRESFANETAAPKPERGLLFLVGSLLLIAGFVAIDPVSVRWKYLREVDAVVNGYEGEIATAGQGDQKVTFLNNTLYRAGITLPSIEKAVHLPAAMHQGALRRALVVVNNGQVAQLRKYKDLFIQCLETEPLFSGGTSGCVCGAVETYRPESPFDLVLLGSGLPVSGAAGRFYTIEFFRKMRKLTNDSGVFSFTLPLGENYLSPQEQQLKDMLQTTLLKVFRYCRVVPGEGYTFVASGRPLSWPVTPQVKTEYLEPYILPSLSSERIAKATSRDDSLRISTLDRPMALLFAQQHWLRFAGVPLFFSAGLVAFFCIVAVAMFPRTGAAFSVGTSGFLTGVYSVALLLVYQYTSGALYSRIALLLVALAAGFVLGSRMKRFPCSDCLIGAYAMATMLFLVKLPYPPLALFMLLHACMGFLAGAQFVTRKGTSWGRLYAADCLGGVAGMALCSTVFVPFFGVTATAIGLCLLKILTVAIGVIRKPV